MVYRKNFRKTPRFKRRKPPQSKWVQGGNLAFKALKIAVATRALLNVERKIHEVTLDFPVAGAAGIVKTADIVSITDIPAGDDFESRDGRKIRVKSIFLTAQWKLGSPAVVGHQASIYLVQAQNKSAITQAGLFNNVDINPLRALDTVADYKILWSKHTLLSPNGREVSMIDKFIKCSHVVMFDKDSTTGTTYAKGQLAFVLLSDTTDGLNISFEGQVRVRYLDN